MGAWSYEPFDNDDAADWVYDLEVAPDFGVVRGALQSVVDTSGYLEAVDGSVGIAAAEVVAAAHGQPNPSLPESVAAWASTHAVDVSDSERELAVAAVDRIAGDDSELPELWREVADGAWAQSVQNLRRRLTTI